MHNKYMPAQRCIDCKTNLLLKYPTNYTAYIQKRLFLFPTSVVAISIHTVLVRKAYEAGTYISKPGSQVHCSACTLDRNYTATADY